MNYRRNIFVKTCFDHVLVDDRVLSNLLQSENIYHKALNFNNSISTDRRREVTEWMLEVSQIQQNSNQIFLSAVRYLDIILHHHLISSKQLQTLASACLCLASKILDPRPLSLQHFVRTPEIQLSQLQEMELLVLTKLRWELCAPTSLDFLPFLLSRLQLEKTLKKSVQDQAETFLVLSATESCYIHLRPSLLVSCITNDIIKILI